LTTFSGPDFRCTFGIHNHTAVCVHFKGKVPYALRRKGHSALTVTVADLDGLVLAFDPRSNLTRWTSVQASRQKLERSFVGASRGLTLLWRVSGVTITQISDRFSAGPRRVARAHSMA
jgi:hypothetical protein